ncbi:MAG TPA: hypothetical protein VLU96_03375 [Gaiellaceae bacterium]|nr:hypothetical protein [Gaiellaceae bacterium]
MRHVLAIAALAVGISIAAAPAQASSTKGPTLRSLQAQITTLRKQVKTLKKQVTSAQNAAYASLTYGACSTAVTADTFQDTYTGLDGYFSAHTLPGYFGLQAVVNDYGACQALQISRAHNQSPPSTSGLRALLDLFKPAPSSARAGHLFDPFLAVTG